jgi:hypothetical protein
VIEEAIHLAITRGDQHRFSTTPGAARRGWRPGGKARAGDPGKLAARHAHGIQPRVFLDSRDVVTHCLSSHVTLHAA